MPAPVHLLVKSFLAGASVGIMVPAGLVIADPRILLAINGASEPWLPFGMLIVNFGGLFGICFLATSLGDPSGRWPKRPRTAAFVDVPHELETVGSSIKAGGRPRRAREG
jgi:hypothetical protein